MFLISILCLIISSYIFLSIIQKRSNDKTFPGFLYFLIIVFSQIIISFEILSLLKIISRNGFFLFNTIFLTAAIILFFFDGRYIYKPNLRNEIKKIIFSLTKGIKRY